MDDQSNVVQKQPSRGVLIKMCSENMQQMNIRTPMPKCDFNKVAKTAFPKNTSGRLLLVVAFAKIFIF